MDQKQEGMQQNKDRPRVYDGDRFQGAEYTNNTWHLRFEQGVTREDILHQEYWSHVSAKMRPYDEIKARCDDGTVYARFLVLDCGRSWAKVHILEWHSLTSADVAQSQTNSGELTDYVIEWKGGSRKFVISRKSDGAVISEGEHGRKEAAELWLSAFIRQKAATASPA